MIFFFLGGGGELGHFAGAYWSGFRVSREVFSLQRLCTVSSTAFLAWLRTIHCRPSERVKRDREGAAANQLEVSSSGCDAGKRETR